MGDKAFYLIQKGFPVRALLAFVRADDAA